MNSTRTLKSAFNQVAEWYPEKDAFIQAFQEDRRCSFQEANRRARRFANGLRHLGVEKGDRVAFLSRTSVEHAIAYFAISKIGAIPVTLHNREAPGALGKMINRVNPSVLVFQPNFTDHVEQFREQVERETEYIVFDQLGDAPDFALSYSDIVADQTAEEPQVSVSPEDVAFLNFTSGSTGEPDPIVHTHSEAIESMHAGYYLHDTQNDDVVLNAFSPAFIAWPNSVFPTLNTASTNVFLEKWDVTDVLDAVDRYGVTRLILIPTMWKMLMEGPIEDYELDSIRIAGYAGEPMSKELFQQLREEITDNIFGAYGSTESMLTNCALRPENITEETLESVGRPMPNVEARIIEPESKDPEAKVERGEIGELILRGPAIADRVWKDEERTKERFHSDGWWLSGDLARVEADGNIYLQGRTDNMIISGGINIYPERVEKALEGHPEIIEAAVIGVEHEKWGEAVTAFIRANHSLTADELEQWCKDNPDLADYQRPQEFRFVEDLPRTNTGKIDHQELRKTMN